ncbi:MAG: hypothetical protein ACXVDH_00735 [Nocardioides sp.]
MHKGSRLEVAKLAQVLTVDPAHFAFLAGVPAVTIRSLRHEVELASYRRHESRFDRIAAIAKLVPPGVLAAIVQKSMGPQVAARVAGAMAVEDAVKIARHLDPEFIADMAPSLDPRRIGPIAAQLSDELIVEVGRLLLRRRQYVTAGRLVPVITLTALEELVGLIGGSEILQIALYVDDPKDLERVVDLLADDRLFDIVQAAAINAHLDEAVMLVESLPVRQAARIIGQAAHQTEGVRNIVIDTVARNRTWDAILPALALQPAELLPLLANVPATIDPAVMAEVLAVARKLDLGRWLVLLVVSLDDDHIDALSKSEALQDPESVAWLIENLGSSRRLVKGMLRDLGAAAV